MQKWNVVFDVALCTGCHNCTLAVQDEYIGNDFPGYAAEMPRHGHRWVEIERCERGSFPAIDVAYQFRACQHCDNPPCQRAAEGDAVRKRPDGIVVIDPVRARGQKQIAEACPYRAVSWNENLQLPQHWNFDAHLIDAGWSAPRPVQACPTGALRALKITDDEMNRIAADQGLERLDANGSHRTRVYYRNLYRITQVFAAGTLLVRRGEIESCVAGARMRLWRGDKLVGDTQSDAFGDFRFDALAPFSGEYRVEVSADGCRDYATTFELGESHWLGELRLDAA
jgi:Fe-S-cluster-containing dehydrogenase component